VSSTSTQAPSSHSQLSPTLSRNASAVRLAIARRWALERSGLCVVLYTSICSGRIQL